MNLILKNKRSGTAGVAWLVYECYISYLDLFDARATICQYLLGITKKHPPNKKYVPFWREGSDKGSIDPFCSDKLFSGTNLSAIHVTQPGHHRTATRRLGPSPMRTFRPNRSSIKIWSLSVHCATKMVGFKAPKKIHDDFVEGDWKTTNVCWHWKTFGLQQLELQLFRIVFCWFSPFQMVPLQCGTWFQKNLVPPPEIFPFCRIFFLRNQNPFGPWKKVSSTVVTFE